MMSAARILLTCLGAFALSGCVSYDKRVGASPDIELTDLTELPAPKDGYLSRVQSGDLLKIEVLNSDLLTGTYQVDEEGMLGFPIIGQVPAANLFPTEIATEIENRLAGRYVLNPEVNVIASEVAQPSVSIGGEVERPGTYPARTSRTLMRAINNAGGFTEFSKADDVIILRQVDGARYVAIYNLEAIRRGNLPDPALYSNDVVTVGDSPSRRNLAYILGFMPAVSAVSLLIFRLGV